MLLSKNKKTKIHRTKFGFFFLYGCQESSLTPREEHRLRLLENNVLRKIFGPKGDEVTGKWRRQQEEELNDLYSSPNTIRVIKSRRMRWRGNVARMGDSKCIQSFGDETWGKELTWKMKRSWGDNIQMNLQEVGWEGKDWIDQAEDSKNW